jgi:hypothetical protein
MNAHTTLKPARRSILRWLGVVSMTLVVGTAAAQATVATADVELALVHGTKASASASPSGWPELNKPPFDAYNHYVIHSTKKLTLQKGAATKESLPGGESLEATLVETTPKVKIDLVVKDSKGALISKASYASPKGKRFIPVSTPYKGGSLVVGLKVL